VYAKNGIVPIQASERRLRPVVRPGRSASGTASDEMGYAPNFAGHSVAIRFFAAVCWPLLANLIFA
jgi:hypothetical protein